MGELGKGGTWGRIITQYCGRGEENGVGGIEGVVSGLRKWDVGESGSLEFLRVLGAEEVDLPPRPAHDY